MSINPKMWDDEHYLLLSDQAKLLWCHLLTGYSGGIPGLIQGGVATFADAMRYERAVAESCLAELAVVTFIEYDRSKRLLRIPSGPKYKKPGNANVLKGWLRRWKDLPESALKYRHLDSMRDAGDDRKWFAAAWSETFGEIKIPEHSRQVPLFKIEQFVEKEVLRNNSNNNGSIERESLTRNKSDMVSDSFPPLHVTETATSTETETSSETSSVSSRGTDVCRELADTIWLEQEEMRAQLRREGIGKDTRSLGLTNPAKAELVHRISEILASGGTIETAAEDCRHVLAVLESEARASRSQRWINGAHWEKKRFNSSMALETGETMPATRKNGGATTGRIWQMAQEAKARGE